MDDSTKYDVIEKLDKLDYEGKRDAFVRVYYLGLFDGMEVNDKLVLISLVSLTYLKMKEKNEKITPLDILLNITKQKPDNSSFYQMLEALSIFVEEFTYQSKTADSCGLKTSQEVINKIKEILSTWMPF
jgi:hypothetical protein